MESDSILFEYRRVHKLPTQEAVRRRSVRLIFAIYWLLIFEGALRKWGFPSLQELLFFATFPFTLWLYAISLSKHRWPRTSLLSYAYFLAIGAVVLVPIQFAIGGYGFHYFIIAGYGWLSYFFYIPLTFIIAKEFNREDVVRLLRHTLWIGILSAPIVALQFASPPLAKINVGDVSQGADAFRQLGSALGHVRPAGFFSSSLGLWIFLGALSVAVLHDWLSNDKKNTSQWAILILGTGALLSMLAFSGSRGAVAQCALVVVAAATAGLIAGGKKLFFRAIFLPLMLLTIFLFSWPIIFPSAYDAFIFRWS
ncbi:MAG: hypothetical protein ACYCOU_04930, partial [Sulfobacillus sp.]